MAQSTMSSPPLRIAIIGAGPGGTCLARILSQLPPSTLSHLSITIFEGETALNVRSQGGTLDLRQDSGLAAIRAANLMDEFNKYARYDGESLIICDKHFLKWMVQVGDKEDKNARAPEIDRFRLRQILLDSVPSEMIRWGKRLERAEEEKDGKWALDFKDGSSEGGFDLVVGADGTWSKVRPTLTATKPKYSGVAGWAFTISEASKVCPSSVELIKGGNLMSPHDRKLLSMQQMGDDAIQITVFFLAEENWVQNAPYDTSDVEAVKQFVLKEKLHDWHPTLRAALEKCNAQNTKVHPWTLFELPVGDQWTHQPGLTLLGDAAHIMTPFAGEGVNQALIDATILGQEIAQAVERATKAQASLTAGLDSAAKAYEAEMFARIALKSENTRRVKEITMKDGGLYRNCEEWMLTVAEDGLPVPGLTRPLVSVVAYAYYFFWRMWNKPKP